MPKEIKLAKLAGFCHGVRRAVETTKKIKQENPDKNVCVLGELIHNSHVINQLNELGISSLESLPQSGNGICIIRSHGESPEVFEKIKNSGFEPYDLTCPDVKKVQQKAIELAKAGYYLVIVGKSSHPEVIAIKENALKFSDKILVATKKEELIAYENDLISHKKIGVVIQTTQMISTLNPIVEYLTSIAKDLHIANTICPSTSLRQKEAKELAHWADLMIVIGSRQSANTTHLAEISKEITNTIHIEDYKELSDNNDLIKNSDKIAITAGASTPPDVIENVIKEIKKGLST